MLHLANPSSEPAEKWSEPECPAFNSHSVNEEVDKCPIAYAESSEDSQIPPLIARLYVQCVHIFHPISVHAIATVGCGGGISEITTRLLHKRRGIRRTCLPCWDIEISCFIWCALDSNGFKCCGHSTADIVRCRVYPVHPVTPKHVDRCVGTNDSIEQGKHARYG